MVTGLQPQPDGNVAIANGLLKDDYLYLLAEVDLRDVHSAGFSRRVRLSRAVDLVRPSLLLRGRVFAARRKGVAAGFVLEACGDDTLRVNRHKVLRSGADAWFSRFRPA